MRPRMHQQGAEPPKKRIKLSISEEQFSTVEEIRALLRIQNHEELIRALTRLRNQLTIKAGETRIVVQDERLLLAQGWVEADPGAHDIFELWERTTQNQTPLVTVILGVLSALLALFSSHQPYHRLGQPILKTLLSPHWIRRLNSFVKGSHSDLKLVALKLLNGMSSFAGGGDRKKLLESFAWDLKALSKLLHMRRKSKRPYETNGLRDPDIRTLYLLFVISFVSADSATSLKTTFLEQHRDVFLSIFKGLVQDSYPVVLRVLESCWQGILLDSKLKRTLKVSLFNETTIVQIVKLYDIVTPENHEADVPADIAHHFLLALCTRPGTGVCFKDRGWYPRDSADEEQFNQTEEDPQISRGRRIHNKILARVLKSLKVNEDPRQQELALKIMAACPELPSTYWNGVSLTLEPRLSSKWIANISFLGSVVSLPVPVETFVLPQSTLYQPSPPPLSTILENILPSVNSRTYISKGLQSNSPLVRHCTSINLARCLLKYADVIRIFGRVRLSLDEDEQDGQWSKRLTEIEREMRKRVPDFQVVVAFAQQSMTEGSSSSARLQPNAIRSAMLAESAQRLLWLYHLCLPHLVAEARFDVGKLLHNFISDTQTSGAGAEDDGKLGGDMSLRAVRQLHILRLLKESDQFVWNAKPSPSSQTYIYTLLRAYSTTLKPTTRHALTALLCQSLSESTLFQEDADEPILWLAALPMTRRALGAEAPDGALLTDESESVIRFLDDCMVRCHKTPYRYVEELQALVKVSADRDPLHGHYPKTFPSPLIMTVLEKLRVQISIRGLTPSDVLALASFIRKLVFTLSTRQQTLGLLHSIVNEVDTFLCPDQLFPEHPITSAAIRREISIMHFCLGTGQQSPPFESESPRDKIEDLLDQMERLIPPKFMTAKVSSAFELVDWMRLVDFRLSSVDICRITTAIELRHKPALKEFWLSLHPAHGLLWEFLDATPRPNLALDEIEFDWMLAQSHHVGSPSRRKLLVDALYAHPTSLFQVERAIYLLIHRLLSSKDDGGLCQGFFILLGEVLRMSRTVLDSMESTGLREYVFSQSPLMAVFGVLEDYSEAIFEGLTGFIEASLNPSCPSDRKLVIGITSHYLAILEANLISGDVSQTLPIKLWTRYMEPSILSELVTLIGDELCDATNPAVRIFLPCILQSLQCNVAPSDSSKIAEIYGLPRLVSLLSIPGNDLILEEMIAATITASLPINHDATPCLHAGPHQLVSRITSAEAQWSRRHESYLNDLCIETFLDKPSWTVSTVQIISGILYRQPSARPAFLQWLATDSSSNTDIRHFTSVMHAFLDASSWKATTEDDNQNLEAHFPRLVDIALGVETSKDLRSTSTSCMSKLVVLFPSRRHAFFASIESYLRNLSSSDVHSHIFALGDSLRAALSFGARESIHLLIEHGLHWFIQCCVRDGQLTADEDACITYLIKLMKTAGDLKSPSIQTAFIAAIKHRLNKQPCINLLSVLFQATQLKPLVVNRQLQSVLQHPQFFQLCSSESLSRDSIINLLHVHFHSHPVNTCQLTHIDPLIRVYTATCSVSDLQLLSIFRLFECQRGSSLATLVSRWSPIPDLSSNTALDAVNNLDPSRVLRTCLTFPGWRRSRNYAQFQRKNVDKEVHDPMFLILLCARMLLESPPSSTSGWAEFFRTNIVSLLIRCMSSRDDDMRDMALHQIVALWKSLETVDMQEKPHVMHILNLLKNTLPQPDKEPALRLPTYLSLILLHALRGIFYPTNFLFPLTARFLLQRPALDVGDVPMLYGMLYSSSDDWKKERLWMIRFLSDGMISSEDWKILRRRHTWELLSSFFQSSEDDSLRKSILEVLANLTCNTQATMSLVLKYGLITWIEMQLMALRGNECIAWLKILHNIMAVADSVRLEAATRGEWRAILCRCCSLLVNSCAIPLPTFGIGAQAVLRLSLLPGSSLPQMPSLLTLAVKCLKRLEDGIEYPQGLINANYSDDAPPYTSHGLQQQPTYKHPLEPWGVSVEALWRTAMGLEEKHSSWDGLTCRLLLWRSIVGEEGSPVGEWTRREVVRNLTM